MPDGVVEEEQRNTSGDQRYQIRHDEGSTTIAIGDIREPPDIAQADRRTDRSDEKGASAGETLTPLGLSSGSLPPPATVAPDCAGSDMLILSCSELW